MKSLGFSLQGSKCWVSLGTDLARPATQLLCLQRAPSWQLWAALEAPECAQGHSGCLPSDLHHALHIMTDPMVIS